MGRLTLTEARREILLAAGLTAALESELGVLGRMTPARAVAALLVTVPLALRLRFPVTVAAVAVSGVVVEAALGVRLPDEYSAVLALLIALLAVASAPSDRQLTIGGGVAFAGLIAAGVILDGPHVGSVVAASAVVGLGLLVGRALSVLRFETDALAQRASELEQERDERARIAVAEERRRIARELHDVIGHSISVMGVQAGAVRSVLRADQLREREALIGVERTGRQAVAEMQRLLGLLRADDGATAAPTPSLRRAAELVGDMREAGLVVRLTVHGDVSSLAPGVDLAGFRVLQEALTNALKHAPDARVEAQVRCTEGALEIDVSDDGGQAPATPNGPAGHGLLGMRERVSLYGGELATGPRPDGGFQVRACIPLDPS
jgi:signal transduction histidine kinase